MNLQEWYKNAITSKSAKAMPIMTHPGIELVNATVLEAVTNAEVHYKAIEALHKKYPSAAVTMIMDLTVEAEALGCKINFEKDDIPTVREKLIHSPDDIDQLTLPDIAGCERMNQYLKAAELAVKNIHDVPVFPGCIGPFSLAGRLIDMSEIMVEIYMNPDAIHTLLQKCTNFIKTYVQAYKSIGTQGIVIAEPAAGLLGEDECNAFSSNYIKEIVDELQDDQFLVILHNCGHQGHLAGAMVATGARALHFGNAADMQLVLESVPKDYLVMGNLDPVNVLKTGTPESVKEDVESLLRLAGNYPNFMISSGCDMPPGVPHENIEAFFKAVETFRP